MKYFLSLSVLFSLALVAGCGDGAGTAVDTGAADTGAADTSTPDTGTTDGGGSEDGGASDAGRDSGASDSGGPVDAAPAIDSDVARCDYVAVDEVIVQCDGRYTFVNHFTSTVPGCPPFYGFTPDGPHFDSFAAVIASDATCDATCEWHFATSVSRIYCGHRDGYEVLAAEGCADVYRFAEGYFASVEAHDAAHPCP